VVSPPITITLRLLSARVLLPAHCPQGTQFGRANTAGAVLVTPATPDLEDFDAEPSVTGGNHDQRGFTGVLNLPITEEFGARMVAHRNVRDG